MAHLPDRVRAALVRYLGAPLRVPTTPPGSADAIVVLGASLRADGSLTSVLDERVRAGAALFARGVAPIVCMTGGATSRGRAYVEADAMAERARELGVPEAALRRERASRNTAENARYTARLLGALGCRRVVVVSQPFHLRRALWLFRKYGLEPVPWHHQASIEFSSPNALRWIGREYASVVNFLAWEIRQRSGGRRDREQGSDPAGESPRESGREEG